MTNLKTLFSRALLALALLTGATAAYATPVYHVAVDTTGTGGDGYMQIDFLPFVTTDVLTATIGGLSGAFTGTPDLTHVTQSGNTFTFSSDMFSEFFQTITLGGKFGFDVSFGGTPTDGGSTTFSVSLIDGLGNYLSLPAAQIVLAAGTSPAIATDAAFATVTVNPVPEPADWALVMTGLLLLAALQRRRA
jgi:MYXO-CTERM domain-containing protein